MKPARNNEFGNSLVDELSLRAPVCYDEISKLVNRKKQLYGEKYFDYSIIL